jgi:hypothetical protein
MGHGRIVAPPIENKDQLPKVTWTLNILSRESNTAQSEGKRGSTGMSDRTMQDKMQQNEKGEQKNIDTN